jgi:hypothetical protein
MSCKPTASAGGWKSTSAYTDWANEPKELAHTLLEIGMLLRTWRFLTIMFSAVALSAALAHLMELPGKMTFDARLYVMLHRTLYPTFGQTAGWAEGFALLSVVALSWRVRKRGSAFLLTAAAAVCQVVAMAIFLVFVQPANHTMAGWSLDAIPSDWASWRDQWEYGHAARAVLETVGLAALVLSVLQETPPVEADRASIGRGVPGSARIE